MNSNLIERLTAYFATSGTLEQAVQFANAVASDSWSQIAHLVKIVGL
jgi:hypothetical protein